VRSLRIYSFDPALAAKYELAGMSGVTIEIPWEVDLKPGPVGEYVEVIDIDPASGAAYPPVDLNSANLLATDGLAPSESDPRFHQQMCYAVAMKTIEHFERALGRKALWSAHRTQSPGKPMDNYVPRLRIYPHALRQQNAYYSPQKKALLFGYFSTRVKDGNNTPGTTVFTCLSHDIIAHEMTHALLDGVHPRFNEPVNEDVFAFHEAFADIVALFQHFSYPGVLRDQIARTKGDLARKSVLGQLAQQFALASGRGDSLRHYLGHEVDGVWIPESPDPTLLETTAEPHDRGAILVAAVFGAFTKVYQARTRDLFRIASEGTGVLRDGDIHPDLVGRLAEEAQRCAERALQMCIRAIDYCPPVGITFGAYLRAVVTADFDMNPSDRENWRLAFIESFREWGIAPRGIRSMGEDSLLWPTEKEVVDDQVKRERCDPRNATARSFRAESKMAADRSHSAFQRIFLERAPERHGDEDYERKSVRRLSQPGPSTEQSRILKPVNLSMARDEIWRHGEIQAAVFHSWLFVEEWEWLADVLGIVVNLDGLPKTISGRGNQAKVEIHSVRTAVKRGPLGLPEPTIVVVVTQWRSGFFDEQKQAVMDAKAGAFRDERDFKYRAGCTLLIDPERMKIRRVIRTPGTVADDEELKRMRNYLMTGLTPANAFSGVSERSLASVEPFALLHSHAGE